MPGLLGAEEAVRTAKEDLASRLDPHQRSASTTSIISLPASLDMGIRRGSSSLMRRRGHGRGGVSCGHCYALSSS